MTDAQQTIQAPKVFNGEEKQKLNRIPCSPAFKIIEDELIVGILTETGQFIQLSEPISENEINKNK